VTPLYDAIGPGYTAYRQPDPRIAAAVEDALGDARSVLNVGAGAGAYEPADRLVTALEPSMAMIGQRGSGRGPAVQGVAEALPFRSRAFDAAMGILTIHHWTDRARGCAELARVARHRLVLLTWEPTARGFWLTDEYFPQFLDVDRPIFPSMRELEAAWPRVAVRAIPVPHDCRDGFLGAYWRRPHAYLDAGVRRAISTFSKIGDVRGGLDRLARDLADGAWERRHADLLGRTELDLGYRLVVAELG
jgi:SAM-dependent methyltransferase